MMLQALWALMSGQIVHALTKACIWFLANWPAVVLVGLGILLYVGWIVLVSLVVSDTFWGFVVGTALLIAIALLSDS